MLHLPKFGAAAVVSPKKLAVTKTTYNIHVFVWPKTKSINFPIEHKLKVTFRGRKQKKHYFIAERRKRIFCFVSLSALG